MAREGLNIHRGYAIEDVRDVARTPWPRVEGSAAFVYLEGMRGLTGMEVVEIPPHKALLPQRHMYHQLLFFFSGNGVVSIRYPGTGTSGSADVEWEENSLLAIPLNAIYEITNQAESPALYVALNDAPLVMDLYRNDEFIFDNDFEFHERFDGSPSYFSTLERYSSYAGPHAIAHFVRDVSTFELDEHSMKGKGLYRTAFEMAEGPLVAHVAEWPRAHYQRAHHHQGGAVILGLDSTGYALMWPVEAGVRPYESGNSEAIVRSEWRRGSVYSPPAKWYHQHFNTGEGPARHIAFRRGGLRHPTDLFNDPLVGGKRALHVSVAEGGTLIAETDEDPQVRRGFMSRIGTD